MQVPGTSSRPLPCRSAEAVFDGLMIQSPSEPRTRCVAGTASSLVLRTILNGLRALCWPARAGPANSALVLDPWNGSGSPTFSASQFGFASRGIDFDPVMLVVARAGLVPRSEADSLEPLARRAVKGLRGDQSLVKPDDPPLVWWKIRRHCRLVCVTANCSCRRLGTPSSRLLPGR